MNGKPRWQLWKKVTYVKDHNGEWHLNSCCTSDRLSYLLMSQPYLDFLEWLPEFLVYNNLFNPCTNSSPKFKVIFYTYFVLWKPSKGDTQSLLLISPHSFCVLIILCTKFRLSPPGSQAICSGRPSNTAHSSSLFVLFACFLACFSRHWDRVSLCSPDCPGAYTRLASISEIHLCLLHAGIKLKVCTSTTKFLIPALTYLQCPSCKIYQMSCHFLKLWLTGGNVNW